MAKNQHTPVYPAELRERGVRLTACAAGARRQNAMPVSVLD